MKTPYAFLAALAVLLPGAAGAQLRESAAWASYVPNQYQVTPDITYLTAEGYDSSTQ